MPYMLKLTGTSEIQTISAERVQINQVRSGFIDLGIV
jgi:hypothetical protein